MNADVTINSVLEIAVIGDIFVNLIPVDSLKSCRLVSRQWHKWFSPSFWRKGVHVLRTLDDLHRVTTPTHEHFPHTQNPLEHIVFKFPFIADGPHMSGSLDAFWNLHGQSLHTLKMEDVESCGKEHLKDILYRKTPNLRKLIISHCCCFNDTMLMFSLLHPTGSGSRQVSDVTHLEVSMIVDKQTDWGQREFMRILFQKHPRLTVLRLQLCFTDMKGGETFLVNCFQSLLRFRNKMGPETCNLKELDLLNLDVLNAQIADQSWWKFLKPLEDLNFPLQTLAIDLGGGRVTQAATQILQMYHKTLQKLVIYRPSSAVPYDEFPFGVRFESLKDLRISDRVGFNLMILKNMPNLVTLHLCDATDKKDFLQRIVLNSKKQKSPKPMTKYPNIVERSDIDSMGTLEFKNLKKVYFSYANFSGKMKRVLSAWFPHAEQIWMADESL